jgi:hypothetical protein
VARRLILLVAAVTLLLDANVPLQASPSGNATIEGPGLNKPIVLSGQPLWDFLYLTRLLRGTSGPPPGRSGSPDPRNLGPRYEVAILLAPSNDHGRIRIRQVLFPYSRSETGKLVAWVYTSPSQRLPTGERSPFQLASGWWSSHVLFKFLLAVGLPESAPNPEATDNETREVRPGQSPPGFSRRGVWLGLLALGVLLLLGAVTGRPSETHTLRETKRAAP